MPRRWRSAPVPWLTLSRAKPQGAIGHPTECISRMMISVEAVQDTYLVRHEKETAGSKQGSSAKRTFADVALCCSGGGFPFDQAQQNWNPPEVSQLALDLG